MIPEKSFGRSNFNHQEEPENAALRFVLPHFQDLANLKI